MGIDNRDYLREPVPGGGFGSSRPTGHGMVFRIVMATVVVFVLRLLREEEA